MDVRIEPSWKALMQDEFMKPYFQRLTTEVKADYLLGDPPVYPPAKQVFNAFELSPFDTVKVVILGQDPYHGPGQAMGLAFSVPEGVKIPPSLLNVYKEIRDDIGNEIPNSGNLERWAKQGVLLLNTTLTVEHGSAGSHQGRGWERFTDSVIERISDDKDHVVFLLWGAYAGAKATLIDESKHLVLKAPHPSPLSAHRGFFGCQHFSRTNDFLARHGMPAIDW